jgi:hypothetical protein
VAGSIGDGIDANGDVVPRSENRAAARHRIWWPATRRRRTKQFGLFPNLRDHLA